MNPLPDFFLLLQRVMNELAYNFSAIKKMGGHRIRFSDISIKRHSIEGIEIALLSLW